MAYFKFSKKDLGAFEASCTAVLRNVERGTKKATDKAAKEILEESKLQVPKETYTLLNSAYYRVMRRTDTAARTYLYEAEIGYGGNGDPINPKTGKHASYYMVAVHEDLTAFHTTGKAKFLEDPIREYGARSLKRTFFECIRDALKGVNT